MTRQEAANLYGWLKATYPRNYRDADLRQEATTIDNLADVFGAFQYVEVIAEYKRTFKQQKNEPHPSEIRKGLKMDGGSIKTGYSPDEAYAKLRQHPKWYEFCMAYGERECKRAAKICTQTASIGELKFRLLYDE